MSLDRVFQKNEDMVFRKIGEACLLVPIRKRVADMESVYTLNEVAARIWERLDGKTTLSQIRDAMVSEFEVSHQEAEKDMIDFLETLRKIEGVREV